MLGEQLHTTLIQNVLIPEGVPEFIHRDSLNKPRGGFWTSTWLNPGSDWTRWCEAEDFGAPAEGATWRGFLVTPSPTARVLTIDTVEDMMALPWRPMFGILQGVDWEAVFRDYDGVHLTEEGQHRTRWAERFGQDRRDLYGWDCESTVWARWVFTEVRPVEWARAALAGTEGGGP